MSTTVLFTDRKRWPQCGKRGSTKLMRGHWPEFRGRPVVIELPPEAPEYIWDCDTPVVWRISTDWMRGAGIPVPTTGYICVCVHQVQAD